MVSVSQVEKEPALIQPAAVADELASTWRPPRSARVKDWLRLIFSFPAMLITMLAGVVFAFARHGLVDPDIWWHLRDAEYLFAHHQFIREDMYSFTVIGGRWINPEWLAEIPYYLAWRVFGLMGIKIVQLAVIEAIFFGLVYLCWRQSRNIKAAVIACYFAVLLATVNFGPRTVLFGYCCLVVLLIVLDRFRSHGKGPLWLLPPLFCLWANLHGTWLVGLTVFGIVITGGLVQGRWARLESIRWSTRQLRQLLFAFGGSAVAVFINPYGFRLVLWSVLYPLQLKVAVEHTQEYQSVNFHDARGKIALMLIVVLLVGALLGRHIWHLTELGLVLFGLYSGLTYERFLFLAAILAAPLLAKLLANVVPPYRREIDKPVFNAVLMVATLVFLVRGFPSTVQLRQSIDAVYPAEILPLLKAHPPAGAVLNEYGWGGYLGWHDRALRDFADTRADIFEQAGVFQDYINVLGLKDVQLVLDKYAIRYVLFPKGEALTSFLRESRSWKVTYDGKICVFFERVGPTPKPSVHLPLVSSKTEAW